MVRIHLPPAASRTNFELILQTLARYPLPDLLARNRRFESSSLLRRVCCEPFLPRAEPNGKPHLASPSYSRQLVRIDPRWLHPYFCGVGDCRTFGVNGDRFNVRLNVHDTGMISLSCSEIGLANFGSSLTVSCAARHRAAAPVHPRGPGTRLRRSRPSP